MVTLKTTEIRYALANDAERLYEFLDTLTAPSSRGRFFVCGCAKGKALEVTNSTAVSG